MNPSGAIRPKNSKNKNGDIISSLPDNILSHILSFLPTKYAVSTCVLSKRWIHLWKFITMLHFYDRGSAPYFCKISKKKVSDFVDFVNRVLPYLKAPTIQSFSLILSSNYSDLYPVTYWVSLVLKRGVKELRIESIIKVQMHAYSFLESPNLEKLELRMYHCCICIPKSLSLLSLTVLKLFGIRLTCDSSNSSQTLKLNLPVLRTYEAEECTWLNVKSVTFEVPLLQVLSIKHPIGSKITDTKFKFRASRLTQLTYASYMLPGSFTLELDSSPANVASANISPLNFKDENVEKTARLTCKLLKKFHSNMRCLTFKRSEILKVVKDSFTYDSINFGMLTQLELGKIAGEDILMFLTCTPLLKTLILEVLIQFEEEVLDPKVVPQCFESNLQVVHFGRLIGEEHEMRFIKYVLEKAQVLEAVKFIVTWELCQANFEAVKEKIFSFKRSHTLMLMEFCDFMSH